MLGVEEVLTILEMAMNPWFLTILLLYICHMVYNMKRRLDKLESDIQEVKMSIEYLHGRLNGMASQLPDAISHNTPPRENGS